MTIAFEIPQDIEQQIRAEGADRNRDAKEVYLMEQYRHARITHRQLEEALGLSFHEVELLLNNEVWVRTWISKSSRQDGHFRKAGRR